MKMLIPKAITEAMIAAGTTIAEPATGETLWISGGTYALGDKRIRAETHRVYECVQAHAGRTALPEADGTYWLDTGPTLRWAAFDQYVSTAATATTSLSYVLKPGFVNAIGLYGIKGAQVAVTVRSSSGGPVVYSATWPVYQSASASWYSYLFLPPKTVDRMIFSDIPLSPEAEVTVTVSGTAGQQVGLGMLVVGDLRPLIGDVASWGGTEQGASAEPVTYSYIKTADDGTTQIVRRHAATGLRASISMPRESADAALAAIQSVLDVPCGWIATEVPGYDGLNVFGLGSARVTYVSFATASVDLTVKGMI